MHYAVILMQTEMGKSDICICKKICKQFYVAVVG